MISPDLIKDVLSNITARKVPYANVANRSQVFKRNRTGADVVCIPSTLSGWPKDIFLKKYEEKKNFLREITAIKLLSEKPISNTNICVCPSILYSDEKRKIIVTERIGDVTLASMMKDLLRLDRVFLNRKGEGIESISEPIKKLVDHLSHFYIGSAEFREGWDHSLPSIIERIEFKFSKLSSIRKMADLSGLMTKHLKALKVYSEKSDFENKEFVYTHGDLCPSNIIIAEGLPYLIDFEDSGFGNSGRDLAYFLYLLESLYANNCYCRKRVKLLICELKKYYNSKFKVPNILKKTWNLEWCLEEILLLVRNSAKKNVFEKYLVKKRVNDRIRAIAEILGAQEA